MGLSEIGQMVETKWIKTVELRPDMNLGMGDFLVMPNHFHTIIAIGANEFNTPRGTPCRDAMHCVSTNQNQFGPQSKNLASIIRGLKSAVLAGGQSRTLRLLDLIRFQHT